MKTYFLKTISISILILLLASCATMKVKNSDKKVDKVQRIALFSTMIGKIQQPTFPLIDAAVFNAKTNSIADQIMDMQKQNIDKCREIVALSLKKTFKCDVIFGDSLQSQSGYTLLKDTYNNRNALRIDNDNYPFVITATGDINPFKFENGMVVSYFSESENYKNIISELSKKVNSDLIAISFSTLSVANVGMLGIMGTLRLDTYLYLFDNTGDLISKAHSWTKPATISGKEIDQYVSQLDNLSLIIEPMMNKIILNYK